MSDTSLLFEGTGLWDQAKPRERKDLSFKPYYGYNVVKDISRTGGVYRPVRNLPVLFRRGGVNDFEGFVFAQGKFLSKYDHLIWNTNWQYQDAQTKLGVSNVATGEFYAFIKASGGAVLVKPHDAYWGASQEVEGFLMSCNGSSASSVQEYFSAEDVSLGGVDPVTGSLIAVNTPATLRNSLGLSGGTARLCGVAIGDTMRETRNNAYQYQRDVEAISVAKEGYLRVPFRIAGDAFTFDTGAAALLTTSNWTTYLSSAAAKQYTATKDQTALLVESPDGLISGAPIRIDRFGNPVIAVASVANYFDPATVGATIRLVDYTFDVTMSFGNEVTTYPGVEVAGNQTGGIDFAVWSLAKKIESPTLTVKQLADLIKDTTNRYYGFATIYFNIP